MQFGKLLAVFQTNHIDSNQTVVTTFIALAVKARLLEISKKYENVPVLRVPGMGLERAHSTTGSSISAGLTLFARNNIGACHSRCDRILTQIVYACRSASPRSAFAGRTPSRDSQLAET